VFLPDVLVTLASGGTAHGDGGPGEIRHMGQNRVVINKSKSIK